MLVAGLSAMAGANPGELTVMFAKPAGGSRSTCRSCAAWVTTYSLLASGSTSNELAGAMPIPNGVGSLAASIWVMEAAVLVTTYAMPVTGFTAIAVGLVTATVCTVL